MATIAVIGAGAVGSYYGALLARTGHDVRFLFRRDLDTVRRDGLRIYSPNGDFHLDSVTACASPEDIGPVEWVICSLKATALESARKLIAPCVGPSTRVVALMNGYDVENRFAEWFGAERIFGGMAFVCINRGEPGVVHHLDYGRVSIGHLGDDPRQLGELHALMTSGGIDVVSAPNLLYARWEKLCWNIPFNGLSVAGSGLGTATILADPMLRATAARAMREVVAVGNADLAAHSSAARLDADEIVERLFTLTGTMGEYRTSMVIDYLSSREMEVEAILGEPFRRAAALCVPVPTIDALYALVRAADLRRQGLIAGLTTQSQKEALWTSRTGDGRSTRSTLSS